MPKIRPYFGQILFTGPLSSPEIEGLLYIECLVVLFAVSSHDHSQNFPSLNSLICYTDGSVKDNMAGSGFVIYHDNNIIKEHSFCYHLPRIPRHSCMKTASFSSTITSSFLRSTSAWTANQLSTPLQPQSPDPPLSSIRSQL